MLRKRRNVRQPRRRGRIICKPASSLFSRHRAANPNGCVCARACLRGPDAPKRYVQFRCSRSVRLPACPGLKLHHAPARRSDQEAQDRDCQAKCPVGTGCTTLPPDKKEAGGVAVPRSWRSQKGSLAVCTLLCVARACVLAGEGESTACTRGHARASHKCGGGKKPASLADSQTENSDFSPVPVLRKTPSDWPRALAAPANASAAW